MDTTSKNKTDTAYNATNGTLLILLTIQYFLRVQFLHYVLQCFFLHSYVPRKLQFRTGFHSASSILLLLYLAAMWRLVSYFILTGSLQEEKKRKTFIATAVL